MANVKRNIMLSFVALFSFVNIMNATQAHASDWGCKVLLCASNPAGWQTIAECRPPMMKLIRCLAKPSPCSWPTCPEAGTGGPGYEPYAACPSGAVPVSQSRDSGYTENPGGSLCGVKTSIINTREGGDQGSSWRVTQRPRNPNPYFFDIPNSQTGSTDRFRFNLNI